MSGSAERAQALSRDAVQTARALGHQQLLIGALIREAETDFLVGDVEAAERALQESLYLLRKIGGDAWVADALELAALAAGGRGRPSAAARFLGVCDTMRFSRTETGAARAIRQHVERYRREAIEILGSEKFEAEWARGGALGSAQAMSEALAELCNDESGCRPELVTGAPT
jgi:hypothetical protein